MSEETVVAVAEVKNPVKAPKKVNAKRKLKDLSIIDDGVFIPSIDESYYITKDIESLFKRIYDSKDTYTQKIMLKGPHGAGKTEMAMQFAARYNMPILIMDCANMREPRDWFGYKTIVGSKIMWNESQFDKILTKGNHVILLDELNRVHPNVLNTLIPLLDGRGFTYLEEKGTCIRVGKGTVFFSSMNEGSQYTGTTFTDIALKDRWSRIVEVKYLQAAQEIDLLITRSGISKRDAGHLVDIANQIRAKSSGLNSEYSSSFSTRQLIECAKDFVIGGPSTLVFTMANWFPNDEEDSERMKVSQLIYGKFGTEALNV